MAGIQTIKVTLQRDSLQTPWGFRLQGGADFRSPFTINKITAGSPADGILHRGDVVLEIDQRPVSALLHVEALDLVKRAGGQITFLVQRGLNVSGPLASFSQPRPVSSLPWSLISPSSYLNKPYSAPWYPPATNANPTVGFRSRAMERIPEPKPILSQTGSPIMPGPVPSVSTKTRGYIQPPPLHTERSTLHDVLPVDGIYSPNMFLYPPNNSSNRTRTMSNTEYHVRATSNNAQSGSGWHSSLNNQSNVYVPSYQKKVQVTPSVQRPQQITVIRPQQPYRPASVQPLNLVHRQYNSPMSLYSNDNVQEVMKNHVSHISHVSFVPSQPKSSPNSYIVSLTQSRPSSVPTNPVAIPKINVYSSEF